MRTDAPSSKTTSALITTTVALIHPVQQDRGRRLKGIFHRSTCSQGLKRPPYCAVDKKAHEEADKDRQQNPAHDVCIAFRLMIEIVVMNHAISSADLAPGSARPNVNGTKLFWRSYGVSALKRSRYYVIEANYQTYEYKYSLEQ
jgi:hypothetical protein